MSHKKKRRHRQEAYTKLLLVFAKESNIRPFLDTDVEKGEEEKYWQKSTHGHLAESVNQK